MKHANIPKKLFKKGLFSYSEAIANGLSQYSINLLVNQGLLEHVDRGLYQIPGNSFSNEDIYQKASKNVGFPSAICLWSAMVFYDLTDEIETKTWVWVPASKRIRHASIKPIRRTNPHWDIGIDTHEGYNITSLDRTLVEAAAYQRYIGPLAAHKAFKIALNNKQTDISNIITMAKKLNFFNRITKTLEAYFE